MLSLTKKNMRIDEHYEHDDELIIHYIDTAKEYLKGATGKEFDKEINVHKNIVLILATGWYENRNTAIAQELDRTLTSMLLQAGLITDV